MLLEKFLYQFLKDYNNLIQDNFNIDEFNYYFTIITYIYSNNKSNTNFFKNNVDYYKKIQNVINLKVGLLFKIILKNQCLKFKIQGTDISDKRIFLGNFVPSPNIISSISAIKIYVFDKDNRIIDV